MAKKIGDNGARVEVLERSSADRLADAKALAAAGRVSAAIMCGLYSLEIYLKVRICRRLDLDQLPRAFEIHEPDELLILTGLDRAIRSQDDSTRIVMQNWSEIVTLSKGLNDLRYLPEGSEDLPKESRTTADVAVFLDRLENERYGVLVWLSNQP